MQIATNKAKQSVTENDTHRPTTQECGMECTPYVLQNKLHQLTSENVGMKWSAHSKRSLGI